MPLNTPAVWFTIAVALIGLMFWFFVTRASSPDFPSIIFVSCALAMASIIAIWCAVLGGWRAYSIGTFALVIDGFALIRIEPFWLVFILPLGVALPSTLTIELIKLMFGKFSKLLPGDQTFEEGLQFKLSHLFIVTTVIAVLCGIGQAIGKNVSLHIDRGTSLTALTICAVLAPNTLLSVWGILGKSILWRLAVALPLGIGIIELGIYFMGHDHLLWSVVFGICFGATALLLLLLRLEGYRFVRKNVS